MRWIPCIAVVGSACSTSSPACIQFNLKATITYSKLPEYVSMPRSRTLRLASGSKSRGNTNIFGFLFALGLIWAKFSSCFSWVFRTLCSLFLSLILLLVSPQSFNSFHFLSAFSALLPLRLCENFSKTESSANCLVTWPGSSPRVIAWPLTNADNKAAQCLAATIEGSYRAWPWGFPPEPIYLLIYVCSDIER